MPKKPPKQLELFAETWHGSEQQIRALGLLGWRDPLWTRKIEITLLDGQKLLTSLATIRRLQKLKSLPCADGAPKSTS